MNLSLLEIIALVLAGIGVGGAFVPRFPAVVCAFASILSMHFAGIPYFESKVLIFGAWLR